MGRNFSGHRNKCHRRNFEEEFDFENVAGAFEDECDFEDVAGIFDEEDFRRRPIRRSRFCRAVRRCLCRGI
ncbi:hypothetical protein [Bacillus sp. FJAT-27245]|uniref:hypothetical protein n=1 Tax=Bacillus sp. FJAT-27245 TaxID=1684144 RepID=UPI0012E179CC|nr:hypothetical protein [Bacillus sp. FJAT-27245]